MSPKIILPFVFYVIYASKLPRDLSKFSSKFFFFYSARISEYLKCYLVLLLYTAQASKLQIFRVSRHFRSWNLFKSLSDLPKVLYPFPAIIAHSNFEIFPAWRKYRNFFRSSHSIRLSPSMYKCRKESKINRKNFLASRAIVKVGHWSVAFPSKDVSLT